MGGNGQPDKRISSRVDSIIPVIIQESTSPNPTKTAILKRETRNKWNLFAPNVLIIPDSFLCWYDWTIIVLMKFDVMRASNRIPTVNRI
jgi:hypothetical protein